MGSRLARLVLTPECLRAGSPEGAPGEAFSLRQQEFAKLAVFILRHQDQDQEQDQEQDLSSTARVVLEAARTHTRIGTGVQAVHTSAKSFS